MGPHKNLTVWQKSMDLVRKVYQATTQYPKSETYGLVSQMRRCVVSIPSNIAEGYGRGSNADLVHFLYIALGSSNEIETQIIISKDLSYIDETEATQLETLNDEVMKMLNFLIFKRTHQVPQFSQS
ncbi:MAG: four helix bundle protein [Bacteroidaceae bacterium]|nr:four helix bundle protein [Bacteroidaceae bacterium]